MGELLKNGGKEEQICIEYPENRLFQETIAEYFSNVLRW